MTQNAGKCHLLFSGHNEEVVFAKFRDELIWQEYVAKHLGLLIGSDLNDV